MEIGRFNDAIEDFTFVIQRSPQIAGYFDNRQNAFRRSGRLDDALKDADEAIRRSSHLFVRFSRESERLR